MPEKKTSSDSGYSGPTHDSVRRLICKSLKKLEQRRIGLLTNDKCKNVVLHLYDDAHEQAERTLHTPIFKVIEQVAVKSFFTREADTLLDEKIYKLAVSEDFTQDLLNNLIKSSFLQGRLPLCEAASRKSRRRWSEV